MAVSRLRYDPRIGRFRDPRGRFVSAKAVEREIDGYLRRAGRESTRLADDLRSGRTSLEAWRLDMKRLIRAGHINMAQLARGGREPMDPAANDRVGGIIAREYRYLENWVEQIKVGAPLDGRLAARAKQYTDAAGETFEQVQAEEMLKRGMGETKNILDPDADHCRSLPDKVGCPEWSDRGWLPIGTIPLPRSVNRVCRRNCRCYLAYRRTRESQRAAA